MTKLLIKMKNVKIPTLNKCKIGFILEHGSKEKDY